MCAILWSTVLSSLSTYRRSCDSIERHMVHRCLLQHCVLQRISTNGHADGRTRQHAVLRQIVAIQCWTCLTASLSDRSRRMCLVRLTS